MITMVSCLPGTLGFHIEGFRIEVFFFDVEALEGSSLCGSQFQEICAQVAAKAGERSHTLEGTTWREPRWSSSRANRTQACLQTWLFGTSVHLEKPITAGHGCAPADSLLAQDRDAHLFRWDAVEFDQGNHSCVRHGAVSDQDKKPDFLAQGWA